MTITWVSSSKSMWSEPTATAFGRLAGDEPEYVGRMRDHVTRRVLRRLPGVLIAGSTAAAAYLLAVATNLATDVAPLPGWMQPIARHPFRAAFILSLIMLMLAAVKYLFDRAAPQPALAEDVQDAEERVHGRLDAIELGQRGSDDRVLDRLPPYVRLLLDSDVDHEDTWQLVAQFANDEPQPQRLAREWASSPPAGLT